MKKILKIVLTFIFSSMILLPNVNALEEKFITKLEDNVNFNKDVLGSTVLAGNNVNSSKKINGILFTMGNNIKINGEIDYVISAGNSIDISGKINNDIILAGNNINLSNDTIINRDVIVTGNIINISGQILRDVQIYASDVNITDATISGNVVINADKITVNENSKISKKLSYNKDAKIKIDNKENINEIEKTDAIKFEKISLLDIVLEKIISFIRILVILFLLIIIVPSLFKRINKQQKDKQISNMLLILGKGILMFIIIPILSLILIISNLGISLGFILALVYGILVYTSTIFTGYYFGKLITEKFIKKDINNFLIGSMGLLIIYSLKLIPYVGGLIGFISILFGFGIIYDLFKKTSK